MSAKKPFVVVTRRLPAVVETRMAELFETKFNASDAPLTKAALIEAVKAADVLVPTVTDRIDKSLILQAGPKLKLIANFGNGVDNISTFAHGSGKKSQDAYRRAKSSKGSRSRCTASLEIGPTPTKTSATHTCVAGQPTPSPTRIWPDIGDTGGSNDNPSRGQN